MEPRQNTWAPLDSVDSADLNEWQDKTRSGRAAQENNNFLGTVALGSTRLVWQADTALATGTLRLVDEEADWRDRLVRGVFVRTSQTQRVGQGGSPGDTALNDTSAGPARSSFGGYTGTGAYSNTTTSAAVSNGSPPLNAVGTARSYAIVADDLGTAPVYLYVDPTTGALYLYNNSGSSLWPLLEVELSGDLGMR